MKKSLLLVKAILGLNYNNYLLNSIITATMTNKATQTKPQSPHWMVIYTRSRFEKKIDRMLNESGITSFCPVVKSVKRWTDRNKMVESPLFSSYIFVKVNSLEELKVKQVPGVIKFLSYCGKPVIIRDDEIERIKSIVDSYTDVEMISIQNFNIGSKVKIKDGVLLNYQGVVTQIMGKTILMTIEQLGCVLTIKVNVNQVCLGVAS